ncbi:hypothetical protein BS47DRAFT_1488420 [Hydnum rufescens UP504]|uniref:Uncharacterized protein n=1 Tax=Hydnum rufescens UP504 TaxID=1448309 RepID=A0A9P6AMM4_9AGAM|nr:hypothetical protein BS47DRAFT_1488420 [Hydnum rufescens UP504]
MKTLNACKLCCASSRASRAVHLKPCIKPCRMHPDASCEERDRNASVRQEWAGASRHHPHPNYWYDFAQAAFLFPFAGHSRAPRTQVRFTPEMAGIRGHGLLACFTGNPPAPAHHRDARHYEAGVSGAQPSPPQLAAKLEWLMPLIEFPSLIFAPSFFCFIPVSGNPITTPLNSKNILIRVVFTPSPFTARSSNGLCRPPQPLPFVSRFHSNLLASVGSPLAEVSPASNFVVG